MKKQTESDLVAEAVAYMRLHFARPLKLTKVARHVGCSPAYLSRKFQAERSCTFTYCPEPDPGRTEQAASPQPCPHGRGCGLPGGIL
ncbi:MAG: AraC family transcriptional regulator [Flavonifractor plautii]